MQGSTMDQFVLAACLAAAFAVPNLLGAPPPNDDFANRIPLAGARLTVTGSNVGATREPGEPIMSSLPPPDGPPISLKTVWWTWTAPADGGLAVSLNGSDFAADVNLCTGTAVSNLTSVWYSPWGWEGHAINAAELRVTAGTVYQIAVGSLSGVGGTVLLNLAFMPRPVNDDFASRIELGIGAARARGSTFGATDERGEPLPVAWLANGTVWWSWTALETGPTIIQMSGVPAAPGEHWFVNGYPIAFLNVFVGDQLEDLTLVARSTGWYGSGPVLAGVVVDAVAGRTYQVAVGGDPGYLGWFDLAMAKTAPPAVILTNPRDGAEFKAGAPIEVSAQVADPEGRLASVEFIVRDTRTGADVGQTDPARPFELTLSNLPPGMFTLMARARDGAGIKADSIPSYFNVRPVNDAFADRIPVAGTFVTVTGILANASTETNQPPESWPDIWWAWTAPASGTFTITATTDLEVFTGNGPDTLSQVAREPGSTPVRAVVQAQAGVMYSIAVRGWTTENSCALHIAPGAPPRITLTSPMTGMSVTEGTLVSLSVQASDPDGSISRVEYFASPDNLLGAVSNAPFSLSILLTQGSESIYAVATDNQGITTRSAEALLLIRPVPPANDNFANRIRFTGSSVTVTGNPANATVESGEPYAGYGSAWWEWTAPGPGDFTITAESMAPAYVGMNVYSGAGFGNLAHLSRGTFGRFGASSLARSSVPARAGDRFQLAVSGSEVTRITVTPTLPPVVSLSMPTNGALFVVGDTVTVGVQASDPDGTITRVELYQDYFTLLATLTNEPFVTSFKLDRPAFVDATGLEVVAFDNHGVASVSESVWVFARSPGPNDNFADRIPLTGSFLSVTGSLNDATVEVEEDFWTESAWASIWWAWTAPESGPVTITAKGEPGEWKLLTVLSGAELGSLTLITNGTYYGDATWNSAQVTFEAQAGQTYPIAVGGWGQVALSVARIRPPVVRILQPAANAVFQTKDSVVLKADAESPDGSIRRVEFFLDGALLGGGTDEPFAFQTTFREQGFHSFQVRATDDRGVSGLSELVPFEIWNRPPPNDNFADRTALQGWFITLVAEDWGATREPGEPTPDPRIGSIWWSWKAHASGRVRLNCDTPFYLAVCVGTNLAELSVIAATQNSSPLEFDSVAGVSYAIVFQSRSVTFQAGEFRMSLLLDARELRGPRLLVPGLFAFDLRTTFERSWIIEATTNLVDWTPVAAGLNANGTHEFLDPTSASYTRRYYRAVAEK